MVTFHFVQIFLCGKKFSESTDFDCLINSVWALYVLWFFTESQSWCQVNKENWRSAAFVWFFLQFQCIEENGRLNAPNITNFEKTVFFKPVASSIYNLWKKSY